MDVIDDDDTLAKVEMIRRAIDPSLLYRISLSPLDILIEVVISERDGNPLTVTQLLHSLPYSITGIRYNVHRLVVDGWLVKARPRHDRRTVLLWPTDKVTEAFQSIASGARDIASAHGD